jgi:biopolymer transport protein ExbB/TolQ
MDLNLVEMWSHMGLPVRLVVLVLTLQAVACIAATIDRLILLSTSARRSRDFAARAATLLEQGEHDEVLKLANETKGSHLAMLMYAGLRTFIERREAGFDNEKAAAMANRALERKGESVSESLNKWMNVLASTGSTAPFVGLLGTVLGILHAFKLIAESGSGGMGTIGGAIGEALIVTGYGLAIAIPTVLIFNWLSGKIASYETGLVNAAGELVDSLEAGTFVTVEAHERTQSSSSPVSSAVPSHA